MAILDCNGKKIDLSRPAVMGILNLTPDSFYDGGFYMTIEDQLKHTEQMIEEGASIIDMGAISTRPGSTEVSESEELSRLLPSLNAIRRQFPEVVLSVDTFRSNVARTAAEQGADMINDIYGGRYESAMFETIAALGLPYILMHMDQIPMTMQQNPKYGDVVAEVAFFFDRQITRLRGLGFYKIILDPGFGFGKTIRHNYQLLHRLDEFRKPGYPLLVGISRKSMINKVLAIQASQALNGTTVLNTIALLKGADIIRIHDVREAVEAIRLVGEMKRVTSDE